MLAWCHGDPPDYKNSGWLLDDIFFPVEYTDDKNGKDKILGRELVKIDMEGGTCIIHSESCQCKRQGK